MDEYHIAGLVILLVLAAFAVVPFIQIWAINTLFGTAILFTFKNWLAVVVLNMCLRACAAPATKTK